MKKLYLVDISSMFFRAFYAIRPLSTPQGTPCNAIYGLATMLAKLLKEEKPDAICSCYDLPTPSFRKDIYPEYKAHRDEAPVDLVAQIPYIKRLVQSLGIHGLEIAPFEADDLIGTMTYWGLKHHYQVIIVSGDKDFGQLIQPHVELFDTMKNHRYDVNGVKEKWGVQPKQMVDYLALVGDASDNIPGVSGIGPKTAAKLLQEYGTLDSIYENLEKIKSESLREKLRTCHELALLSRRLVTLELEVPLALSENDLLWKGFRNNELRALFQELNFKALEKQFLGASSQAAEVESPSVPLAASAAPKPSLVIDSTTDAVRLTEFQTSLEELGSQLKIGDSVWGFANERASYLVRGKDLFVLDGRAEDWGTILSEKKLHWSGFDLKSQWRDYGISLADGLGSTFVEWDSMLAAYLIKSAEVGTFAETYTEFILKPAGEFLSPQEIYQMQIDLKAKLEKEMRHSVLTKVYSEIELPLIPVLHSMESLGVLIDKVELESQSLGLESDIHRLEKEIHTTVGEVFNVSSPKQLAVILFEKMGITPTKKIKTGFSTNSDVLDKLKVQHPVVEKILEYRELCKLKSTYVDSLPALCDPRDHRVHTHFNQALTTTGRLSSHQPNLQNIPIRTPRGAKVRRAFIAPEGAQILSLDYSQIELRILAHITDDPGLCRAFQEDLDIHAMTAAEVFGVDLSQVDSEMRRRAKAINFGIAYGQGAFGLAENLGISRTEAKEIIDRYFHRFKGVRDYMDSMVKLAKEKGYVTTLFGRHRRIGELQSSSPAVRKFGERIAINAPVQGSASDIVKMAMIKVGIHKGSAKLILQVHDELLFEVATSSVVEEVKALKAIMENAAVLKVPLKVNGRPGRNWDEAH